MGVMNGANMLRVFGVLTTAALMANAGHAPSAPTVRAASPASAAAIDVTALLAAARGAPPLICGLASQSIGNGNWGWRSDIPASPLGPSVRALDNDRGRIENLPDAASRDTGRRLTELVLGAATSLHGISSVTVLTAGSLAALPGALRRTRG